MKAYKAFLNDWTCKGFQFKVGETYHCDNKIELCKTGFHACKSPIDLFRYYESVPWNKYAIVEVSGKILRSNEDSKVCADTILIAQEITFDELITTISRTISGSNGISGSKGISWSDGISESDGISGSS